MFLVSNDICIWINKRKPCFLCNYWSYLFFIQWKTPAITILCKIIGASWWINQLLMISWISYIINILGELNIYFFGWGVRVGFKNFPYQKFDVIYLVIIQYIYMIGSINLTTKVWYIHSENFVQNHVDRESDTN